MKIIKFIIGILGILIGTFFIVFSVYFFIYEDETYVIALAALLIILIISATVIACGIEGIIKITKKENKND